MWFTNVDTNTSTVKIRIEASSLKDANYRLKEWMESENNRKILQQAHRTNTEHRNIWGYSGTVPNPDIVIVSFKPGDNEPKYNLQVFVPEQGRQHKVDTYISKTLLEIADILNEYNESYTLKLDKYDITGSVKGYYYTASPRIKEETHG